MDKNDAAKKLMLINETPGRLTLKEASLVRFSIDETEWLLRTYHKPEERIPSDRGPANDYFPGYKDESGLPLYGRALDLVLAMDFFKIDETELGRFLDMAYRTALMDLCIKNDIKHTGSTIADFVPDRKDLDRHPGCRALIRKLKSDMEFFRQQAAIDHALWSFPEAFDMTVKDVIKHRAEEPAMICSAAPSDLNERNALVKLILAGS